MVVKSFKVALACVLIAAFIYTIYHGIKKLREKKTTFTSSTVEEEEFIYPSITLCQTKDKTFLAPFADGSWIKPSLYDFTFPFDEVFGKVTDRGLNKLGNMNDHATLEGLGMNYSDVWSVSIHGLYRRPGKCYTYNPRGKRTMGITNGLNFRLKGPMNLFVGIHNENAFVPNMARVYGNDFTVLHVTDEMTYATYEIRRTNITELDYGGNPCSDDIKSTHPGHF